MVKPNEEASFHMTCPRLAVWHLFLACLLAIVVLGLLPPIWTTIEPFEPDAKYRTPYDLSEDYWQYRRLINHSVLNDKVLIIGDSVVWGEYTFPDGSLSAALNRLTDKQRFVNGGLNGLHPLAIEGIVRLNRRVLRNSNVVLHCNLLWMSSPERDLSSPVPQAFNHSALVRQFGAWPNLTESPVPSYDVSLSGRIAIATTRNLPYRLLVEHVRRQYFGGQNIHQWSLKNPYSPFWNQVTLEMAQPSGTLRHASVDWTEQGIKQQSFDWVALDNSLQWQAFQRTVDLLQKLGNRVFVVVGPFNTHLLLAENKDNFAKLRDGVTQWLSDNDVPHVAPPAFPSHQYGDASHPLADGYSALAKALVEHETFRMLLETAK